MIPCTAIVVCGLLTFPAAEAFRQTDNPVAEVFLGLFMLLALCCFIASMMISIFLIFFAVVGAGVGIHHLWEWMWEPRKPRGDEPGAEVKMVPYSSMVRREVND